MAFKVINIIDADTIRVSPNYKLGEFEGNIVKIRGYRTPPETEQIIITKRLRDLLINKEVELHNAVRFNAYSEAILSEVRLQGVNVKKYFPQYEIPG